MYVILPNGSHVRVDGLVGTISLAKLADDAFCKYYTDSYRQACIKAITQICENVNDDHFSDIRNCLVPCLSSIHEFGNDIQVRKLMSRLSKNFYVDSDLSVEYYDDQV